MREYIGKAYRKAGHYGCLDKQVRQIGLYTGMGFVNFYRRRRGNTFFWIAAVIICLIGLGLAEVI